MLSESLSGIAYYAAISVGRLAAALRVAFSMLLTTRFFRCLLAAGALSGAFAFHAPWALAEAEDDPLSPPSVAPDLKGCSNESVHRMLVETTAFYRRVGGSVAEGAKPKVGVSPSPRALYYAKEVDRLWRGFPNCSTPENRSRISHHAFKEYMNAMLPAIYASAMIKWNAKQADDTRFYLEAYKRLRNGVEDEAAREGWSSWLTFESWSSPRMDTLERLILHGEY